MGLPGSREQEREGPTHFVPILHDVAGVGVGLDQMVLLMERLSGQILLREEEHTSPWSASTLEPPRGRLAGPDQGSHHVGVLHPVDAVPVTQVCVSFFIIVAGVR